MTKSIYFLRSGRCLNCDGCLMCQDDEERDTTDWEDYEDARYDECRDRDFND